VGDKIARFPFVVAFAYTRDETNHFADVLLPDATDLEGLQLLRIGGTKYVEQFWEHEGFALRQPVVRRRARRATSPTSPPSWPPLRHPRPLQRRHQPRRLRRQAHGPHGDFSLAPDTAYSREQIWDAICRAASAELSDGSTSHGLDWWREHGIDPALSQASIGTCTRRWSSAGCATRLPYQERLQRIGVELGRRLHEHDMHWWDKQLEEYQALPPWKDFPGAVGRPASRQPAPRAATTRSGCSPRAACSTPGAATSACR
jgi:phenylacetyl-CoA:acceptor oxidoreductase